MKQEGTLALLDTYQRVDKTRSQGEQEAFLRQHIRWAMLEYVAANYADVKMNKHQFFNGDRYENEAVDSEEMFVDVSNANPEDLYILWENESEVNRAISLFRDTLSDSKEAFVWDHIMHTDAPLTTRRAAMELGVKSNRTITNIKNRLAERFAHFTIEDEKERYANVKGTGPTVEHSN